MLDIEQHCTHYDGPEMENIIERINMDEMEWVIMMHDESCFHADGCGYYWRLKSTSELRKKDRGSALMVSGFKCACHGIGDAHMYPLNPVSK
jgi:hypothetical protein